jgi:hypothetical protein
MSWWNGDRWGEAPEGDPPVRRWAGRFPDPGLVALFVVIVASIALTVWSFTR